MNNETPASLVAALPSQPLTYGEPYRSSPTQQFVCNTGYSQKLCHEEMVVLRKALANYPVAQLGNWTWILVRSEDWKAIVRPRGLDPDSPAFTFYPKRETFIEEALVTQIPVRGGELLLKWSMSRGIFLISRSATNWVMRYATMRTNGTPTVWRDFWKRENRSPVKLRPRRNRSPVIRHH